MAVDKIPVYPVVLDYLIADGVGNGDVSVTDRLPNFQRRYDLSEKIVDEPHSRIAMAVVFVIRLSIHCHSKWIINALDIPVGTG